MAHTSEAPVTALYREGPRGVPSRLSPRIYYREEKMGRQDSRRGPIQSPTERPEPKPMRAAG